MEARAKPRDSDLTGEFTRLYAEELIGGAFCAGGRRPQRAAAAHLAFGKTAGGSAKLRVYNPVRERDGWASTHTVVEIVNDDMPFLVDSVAMEVNRQGLTLHLWSIRCCAVRDANGQITEVGKPGESSNGRLESFMHVEVDRQIDPAKLAALENGITRALTDVRGAVADWKPMQERMREVIRRLDSARSGCRRTSLDEGARSSNGCSTITSLPRQSRLRDRQAQRRGCARYRARLGARHPARAAEDRFCSFATLPPEARKRARVKELLVLTKATALHRAPPGHLDHVGVKRFDARGEVIGETRFLGVHRIRCEPDAGAASAAQSRRR